MATLLILKRRMKTARNVSKTTRAMQMIAASKLKKAQDAAVSSKPYVQKLESLTKTLKQRVDSDHLPEYMKEIKETNAKLLIVISPDKGLCGGLVTNLMREVLNFNQGGKTFYITIGKKAENSVISLNREVLASFPFGTSLPQFDLVYPVIQIVEEYFMGKKVSEVKVISTQFSSVFSQVPKVQSILPVKHEEEVKKDSLTVFEPSPSEILPDLLKHYIEMLLFQSFLESYASEQAARMIAMKNATDNALDIISELQLEYNKTRQERITNELLDIVGGSQINYE
jgi:F-type H+-transporting ATPase subunit gamma